jgi:hypothetical protein
VLRDLNLRVARGEIYALLGGNGAGKRAGDDSRRYVVTSRHVSDCVGARTNQWTDWWRGGAWGEGIRYWRR